MMRYCVVASNDLSASINSPTVATGSFAAAVRAYAGLVPLVVDTSSAGWRVHECYSEANKNDYFFALCSGGAGREKRWKQGGAFYARSGLHNRLYSGISGGLAGCVEHYSDTGNDIWSLTFHPGYVAAAFEQLLNRKPIPFWSFAAWLARAIPIPDQDYSDAMLWVRNTVISQARLGGEHVAATEAEAIERSAWFYLGEMPHADDFLSEEEPTASTLTEICAQFDERVVAPHVTPSGDGDDTEREIDGHRPLADVLLDAGGGRKLQIDDAVVSAALTQLSLGRHLILVGPPGTGKSTLAENLARAASEGLIRVVHAPNTIHVTTASSSWTAFDTLGGYVPTRSGDLEFRPGVFLRSFASNAWLVVDELNRADADKAFGPFMGILGGDTKTQELPFEVVDASGESHPIRLVPKDPASTQATKAGEYAVPQGWRLIATMNTYDKNSLFRLSYAFMRRFAFIYVGTLDVDATAEAATQGVDLLESDGTRLRSLLSVCDEVGRPLGVAIAADIARFVAAARGSGDVGEPFLDALVAHVLPQLDALEPEAVGSLFESLLRRNVVAEGSRIRLQVVFRQMLDYGR